MTKTPTLLSPGDVVGGFRIEDLIGIGGMATVYRAEQVSLGRAVALKVLSGQLTRDEVFRERFRREGMHAASLEHPNIVPVYDSGEEDGLLYLAMRLVDGSSLAERLAGKGVTADEAIEILRPIASALDCAHAAGLIHRDVKPQNILVTAQGHPHLADFGVAKGSGAPGLTVTGGFVGSVNYASPEQIKGLTLTAASDVYALTAVLYHCLAGDVPYPGESEAGVMHSHLHEPPPTLPMLRGAEGDFHTVFARGMAKDPGARYGHAGDLLNAAAVCVSRMPAARRKSIPAFPRYGGEAVGGQGAPAAGGGETIAVAAIDSLTTADRRREPPPSEPAEEPAAKRPQLPRPHLPQRPSAPRLPGAAALRRLRLPRPSRRLALAGAAAALGAAVVVLIVLLAGGGGGGAEATAARRGPVALSYEAPWQLAPPATAARIHAGLGFRDPLVLRRSGDAVLAGMLADGAAVPGGLPPRLAGQLAGQPSRRAVRLAGLRAVRYSGTRRAGGQAVTLYVVPTASGDLGLLCLAGSSRAAGAPCAQLAATLRVHGPQPVAPGADPKLAAALRQLLGPLATARGHRRLLVSEQPAPRAAAARALAVADTRAVKGLAGLAPEPRDRAAVRSLGTALRREARQLQALAAAAQARHYGAYAAAAKRAHAAGVQVRAAAASLRAHGFSAAPRLRPLDAPPLHRPQPQTPTVPEAEITAPAAPVASEPPSVTAPAPEPAPSSPPSSSTPHVTVTAPK